MRRAWTRVAAASGALLLLVPLLVGCQWLGATTTVLLPQLPVAWSGLQPDVAVAYYDRQGRWRTAALAPPGAALRVSLNRYQHTPVLATPLVYVSGQVIALRPAGGI